MRFQYMILGEGESTGTVDEAKNLIPIEEPEKFVNDVQDEDEGEFLFQFIIFKQHIFEKHEQIK